VLKLSTDLLEKHYKDMQDIEFTVEARHLYMLADPQRQAHGRSRREASPVDMVKKKASDRPRRPPSCASIRLGSSPSCSCRASHDAKATAKKDGRSSTTGLPASPGAAVGKLAFTAAEAVEARSRRRKGHCLSARKPAPKTSTACISGRASSPARRHDQPRGRRRPRHGPPCVAGAGEVPAIDEKTRKIKVGGKTFKEGRLSVHRRLHRRSLWSAPSPPQNPKLSGDFAKTAWAGPTE
jgi:pyruvate,orthophosphate dikinase